MPREEENMELLQTETSDCVNPTIRIPARGRLLQLVRLSDNSCTASRMVHDILVASLHHLSRDIDMP